MDASRLSDEDPMGEKVRRRGIVAHRFRVILAIDRSSFDRTAHDFLINTDVLP